MNKRVLTLSLLLIAIFLLFRFCNNKPEKKVEETKPAPLAISENSGSFNDSFTHLLNTYYSLKDAFITGDTVKVNASALELKKYADNLNVNEIKGDSSIRETAKYFASSISSSAEALTSEKDIEAKRKEFNMITDALWSLTRTVQYNGQKVYYHYCSTAFDNSGAYWLSDKIDNSNPYSGNKMPPCGEVADSLDYSKR